MKGQGIVLILALISSQNEVKSLSYDPSDYLEVYPDPRDPEVLKGRTPLYFALIQSLGRPPSQFDGSGTVAGVKVALDRINNDSSLLPGYTLHYTFTDSACNRTVSLDALHFQLLHEPRKIAVIGSGCSVATEPTAEISHHYNIAQISCLSSSTSLRNRVQFPRYFQLLAVDELLALGFFSIIKEYGWQKIALIVQDENVFTMTMGQLKDLLAKENIEYNERIFNTSSGIAGLGSDVFDKNSRIFLLSMYEVNARRLLCEAYAQGIHLPRNFFLYIGWYSRFWWRVEQPDLTCTVAQREMFIPFTLAVTNEVLLDPKKDINLQTTPGITGGEFLSEERKFLQQPPLNLSYFPNSQHCHDATWTLAYALNNTIGDLDDAMTNEEIAKSFNVTPPFRLGDLLYSSSELLEVIFKHLENTSFDGITGPVSFGSQGIRNLKALIVYQYRKVLNVTDGTTFLDTVEIGTVDPESLAFSYAPGESFDSVWNDFELPYDGVPLRQFVTVHPAVTAVFLILALAGILLSAACIIFNFVFRNTTLIRLSSPRLNYLVGIGAALIYLDTIFFVIPTTNPDFIVVTFCSLTAWPAAIGYSLGYGTILVKMARVYYIFKGPVTRKKTVKDETLLLMVACFVGIDLVMLVTYTVVQASRGKLVVIEVMHSELPTVIEMGPMEVIIENFFYACSSQTYALFLVVLYLYKLVLQIIGLVLACLTRKVKVKGLDDSKYSSAAIYLSSVVLILAIITSFVFSDHIDFFVVLSCIGFQAGATVVLLLVFLPLMVTLYKDPKGERIFRRFSGIINTPPRETLITSIYSDVSRDEKCLEYDMKKLLKSLKREGSNSKKSEVSITKSELILLSLESSKLISHKVIKERTFPGTIWDLSDEDTGQAQTSENTSTQPQDATNDITIIVPKQGTILNSA